ncbi:MAG: hydroxymethylglutaryl-CoA lyase [Thermodesulfobacteriota bacterium]|nr:hydroxymethylglutaryl-CoA lyase [Thermodesulfobacteriota bacterium]
MEPPSKVKIREVAPRDGFQSLKVFLPTEKKLQIIEAMANANVKEIETTSFVSPKAIPQLRDAGDLMTKVPRHSVAHAGLVPNLRGAKDAIAANIDHLVVVISATEAHNQENVRRSINESIADLDAIFTLSKGNDTPVIGSVSVSFGCPYQGDVPEKDVFKVVDAYTSRGATSIILADTTGMATPNRVERMVMQFQDRFPGINPILHFHNNRGTAMANLLAAIKVGATTFDTALGGIGGCPYVPQAAGNLPTEDVVFMLEDMGIKTGINLESIIKAAQLLEKTLGYTLPGQVMKSGPRDPKLAAKICNV